ncbi:hypothetical protein [Paramicrobacterium fandaimingii]|uniref:hypothetical protein n=1 Tax=Paramicrobacterium fandaimingii TaxID=2708079 RepID=UPI00141F75D2|nr:hypothetical protein [Microbacterium fandaimingii]
MRTSFARSDSRRRTHGGIIDGTSRRVSSVLSRVLLTLGALAGAIALAAAPASSANAMASDQTITAGDHITLTTVADTHALRSLAPGVSVAWQVGVSVDSPSADEADIALSSHGDLDLDMSIRACTIKWVDDTCPGDEARVADVTKLTGDQKNIELLSMPTDEQRWLLFTVTSPGDAHGSTTADIQVTANGETIVGSAEASTPPKTGPDVWPALGFAICAIVLGLLIAGIAVRSQKRSSA